MKKWMVFCLCVLLLFSLVSCAMIQPEEPTAYGQAMAAIDSGEYQKAYDLLKSSENEQAVAELEKFVFVPVKDYKRVSTGWDVKGDYTYDADGNLTRWLAQGEDSGGNPFGDARYLYYSNGVLTSEVEQTDEGANTNIYDERGNLLCSTGYSTVYTMEYDDKGNCVSETWKDYSGAENTRVYTYDEAGHRLTARYFRNGEKTDDYIDYTYHENGNLKSQEERFYDEVHRVFYYDEEGRFAESYRIIGEEKELLSQKRYDQEGREIYHRDASGYDVPLITETTYNEQGLVAERKEYAEDPEDEYYEITQYTYDADGNRLTTDSLGPDDYWYKEICTYDAQGNRLTQKTSSLRSWANETVTYDEGGRVLTYVSESNDGSEKVTFERDAYGNPTKYSRYRVLNDAETATEYTISWQLMYYPNGIPASVTEVLEDLDNTMWIDSDLAIRN